MPTPIPWPPSIRSFISLPPPSQSPIPGVHHEQSDLPHTPWLAVKCQKIATVSYHHRQTHREAGNPCGQLHLSPVDWTLVTPNTLLFAVPPRKRSRGERRLHLVLPGTLWRGCPGLQQLHVPTPGVPSPRKQNPQPRKTLKQFAPSSIALPLPSFTTPSHSLNPHKACNSNPHLR